MQQQQDAGDSKERVLSCCRRDYSNCPTRTKASRDEKKEEEEEEEEEEEDKSRRAARGERVAG